jgi:hypothetical protein
MLSRYIYDTNGTGSDGHFVIFHGLEKCCYDILSMKIDEIAKKKSVAITLIISELVRLLFGMVLSKNSTSYSST